MRTWALKEIKKTAIEIGRTYDENFKTKIFVTHYDEYYKQYAITEKHYNRILNKIVGKNDIRGLHSPVFPILVFNENGYLLEF